MNRQEDFSSSEPESLTVYIGNLPRDSIQGDVEHIFSACKIKSIRMVRDRETDVFKGHAFVDFEDYNSLQVALKLDKAIYDNRELKIDRAQSNRNRNQGFRGGGGRGGGGRGGGFGGDGGRGGGRGGGGGGFSRGGGGNYSRDSRDYQHQADRGGGSYGGGGGYRGRGGGGGGGGDRDHPRRHRQSSSDDLPSDNPPPGRPKLNLLPRTVDAPVNAAASTRGASSIFGSGRPRPPTPPNEAAGGSASASGDDK